MSLDWGKKAQAGQVAIADVMTYGGPKTAITPPDGWQLIRDDSTPTTRQSLYWHAIQANDPSSSTWTFSAPVDAQGAIVLLDNVAADAPVDMSNGKTGTGGDREVAASMTTTADGDLILIFKATDFCNAPLKCADPGRHDRGGGAAERAASILDTSHTGRARTARPRKRNSVSRNSSTG